MNRIIEWFTRNGVAANLLMISIVGSGIYAGFNKIVLQEWPDYPSRSITVSVPYRGSTPNEVEKSIVLRLEENLYDLEGLKEMESRAGSNSGSVTLTINDTYDLNRAFDEVKNRVDTINTFPDEAERPQVSIGSHLERVITVVLAGDLSEMDLKRFGEELRDEITHLPGITYAALKAVRPYEISIEVSEATLKEYGLSFDSLVQSIRTQSIDLSAGSIKTEGGNILLRTSQQAYDHGDFSGIVVLTRNDGTRLTLGEIAAISDGFDETPIVSAFNGNRAIAIDVFRLGSQNIIELGEQVKTYVKEMSESLPQGMEISYWRDDSKRISDSLSTLKGSAIMGYCLVVTILSLFLRPSLAFWVALGIPIAFSGAFFVLPIFGVSLNFISLFAFILVLGIVVDDAIVTGESVYQKMQQGTDSLSASIRGTQEVAIPVIFGVITTMVAFYPLSVMTGWRGSLFKQIPVVVIPVLFFSLIESKLILPAHLKHCSHLGDDSSPKGALMRFQRSIADGLERFVDKVYRPSLNLLLNYRYATAAAFIALLLIFIGRIAGDRLPFSGFPRIPRDSLTITLKMPVGTTFEQTQTYIQRIEETALDLKDEVNEKFEDIVIRNVFATTGGSPFGGGYRSVASGVAEQGEVVIEMQSSEKKAIAYSTRELTMDMRRRVGPIPEAEQFSFAFSRGASGALSIQMESPSIEDLRSASQELQEKLATYEGLYDIEDSYERATEELELELKPQAVHLGVTTRDLASQVRQAFFGTEAQRFQRGRDDIRVMVRYPVNERRSLASLQTMMIRTQSGIEVPFEEVANIVPGKSLPSIRRIDRKRIIRVSADGDTETVDVDSIQFDLAENFLPELVRNYTGMSFSLQGRAARARDNSIELIHGIYFVLAAIYILLAIPFKSYIQPLIVMSAIPFGIVGAILGHEIMDWAYNLLGWQSSPVSGLTMLSILGMLALSGVVVNDSLVMVDFINRRTKEGMSLADAIQLAGMRRFRPILLTSLTTFFGLLPLMFESSRNAQFLIPMTVSLGWGVIFATFITLILVPVFSLIVEDLRILFCKLYNIPLDRGHKQQTKEDGLVVESYRS